MDHTTAILERFVRLHPREIDLSLGRLERLLAAMGNPELKLPPVIHVAGTNGKGSTTATMRAILEADGKRVHVYTSPHLVRFHERIRLGAPGGGQLVDDDRLVAALLETERVNDGQPITQFEITTAAAFKLFSEAPADALLLEVGLGGRLDATNVVPRPAASVITSISMDHERYLGDTLEAIAGEKAGILKRGVPAVSAPQPGVVRDVLARTAGRLGIRLGIGGEDWMVAEERGRLTFHDEDGLVDLPLPRLIGRHQHVNTGTAIAALRAAGMWPHDPAISEAGITRVDWPARMQRLTSGRLVDEAPKGAEIWLDGGHNPGAGEVIAAVMGELEERVSRPLVLISGMLNTKDPVGFFRPFKGLAMHVFTVPVQSSDAGRDPVELCAAARTAGLVADSAVGVRSVLRLLSEAFAGKPAPRILICGSLYLAGDVLVQNGTLPN